MTASVLIITDVFGHTPAIDSLRRYLALPCVIASPFDMSGDERTDIAPAVRSEQQAYQAFIAAGGVQAYAIKVAHILRQHPAISHVIGFSAGASAWWLNSAWHTQKFDSVSLFYGSRIRDYLDVGAAQDTHLIFAEQENAFQPAHLVQALRQRGYHAELAAGTKHGFMNPYSAGFSLKAQTHYLEVLRKKVYGLGIAYQAA